MHDAFDFAHHEDTLKTIKSDSKRAEILVLMLQDVCSYCDFIQSYTKDSQFCMWYSSSPLTRVNVWLLGKRALKIVGGGVAKDIEDLSAALVEHRSHSKGFLGSRCHHCRDNCVPNSGWRRNTFSQGGLDVHSARMGVKPSFRRQYVVLIACRFSGLSI